MKALLLAIVVAAAVAAAAPAKPPPGFAGCNAFVAPKAKLAVRPARIMAACGDGNFYFTGLRWSSWRADGAHATGIAHQNDCTPNCAAGRFHTYRATVALTRLESCHGRLTFTRLGWTFPAARPHGAPEHGSEPFPCT